MQHINILTKKFYIQSIEKLFAVMEGGGMFNESFLITIDWKALMNIERGSDMG